MKLINFNFIEMPPDVEMLRYKRAVSWVLRNPSFIQYRRSVGDTLLENNWWLLGKSRYERILFASLYLFGVEREHLTREWFLQSLIDHSLNVRLPLPTGIELWDIIYNLEIQPRYNLKKERSSYSPPMKKILTPLGEEWTIFLLVVFKIGYPRVKEIIGEPLVNNPVDIKSVREKLTQIHQWSLHQGSYVPHRDFLNPEKMSDKLIAYIWNWRRTLFSLYGITPGKPPIWEPSKTSKVILAKSNLDFGLVHKLDGVVNLRPRDTVHLLLSAVKEWQNANS